MKRPWELSRLQWLLPAGQAFRLTGDERYAQAARDILEEWISANPHAWTVNWSCTMEPALRILSWTALFHFLAGSRSWADEGFRGRFLSALYMHGSFVETHIERASINGNHLTADAAGMVFAGLFFRASAPPGAGRPPAGASSNARSCARSIPTASTSRRPFPTTASSRSCSCWRHATARCAASTCPGPMPGRMKAMAGFTAASYSRPDGPRPSGATPTTAAPSRSAQALGDHRYLVGLVALAFGDEALSATARGTRSLARAGGASRRRRSAPASAAFREGGVYILRATDHVFVDCGPVGLAGLGGHGHNDALSFEAWLAARR